VHPASPRPTRGRERLHHLQRGSNAYNKVMRATVIPVGDQKAIRIPEEFLEECGIGDSVDIDVHEGRIVIAPTTTARLGWNEAFGQAGPEEGLLDPSLPTSFDETEWEW
jgi:antitoxin MazE